MQADRKVPLERVADWVQLEQWDLRVLLDRKEPPGLLAQRELLVLRAQ